MQFLLNCAIFTSLIVQIILWRHGLVTPRLDDFFTYGTLFLVLIGFALAVRDAWRATARQ